MLTIARIAALVVALAALTGTGSAAEDDGAEHRPGRAAAHAALTDGADLPANPPSLPELAPDGSRRGPDSAALGKKTDSAREAARQADQRASDSARVARDEAANRIAQTSIVGAVRSAASDGRAAAAQARATSAKAKAAGKPGGMPPHPTPGGRP
jgi:hypothetical protein